MVIAASLIMGFTVVVTKLVMEELNPISTGLYTFLFSLAGSFAIVRIVMKKRWSESFRKYWKTMTVYGLIHGTGAIIFFFSLNLVGPNVFSFLLRFILIFTIILSVLFLKERFNKFEAVGMLIAIAGALIMTYTAEKTFLVSALLVILLAAFISISSLITKLNVHRIDPMVINHIRIIMSFVLLFMAAFSTSSLQVPSSGAVVLLAITGVLAAIGIGLSFKAMKLIDLSKISTMRAMDPFVVICFSFFLLSSIPTPRQFFGGIFIVFGILLTIIARHRPKLFVRWSP